MPWPLAILRSQCSISKLFVCLNKKRHLELLYGPHQFHNIRMRGMNGYGNDPDDPRVFYHKKIVNKQI